MENIESSGSESGVSTPEVSSPQESQSPAATQTEGASQDAAPAVSNDKLTPFHEHPRFKEVIAQKNELSNQVQTYSQALQKIQAQMQEMQKAFQARSQQPNNKPSYDAILNRLQQIDPEFGQFQSRVAQEIASVPELKQQFEELKQWRQEMEMQNLRSRAESSLNQLYEQHKVPENLRKYYKSQIREMALDQNVNSVEDLPKLFGTVHQNVSKDLEDIRRSERESYVSQKKQDVTPATQTGGTPASQGPAKGPMSLDEKIKFVASELRRGKEKI